MDEGTLVKEQDRISTFKHPDRPDITVDVDQTTGSSSVYFDTDEGTKAVGEIQKTMDETTGGKVVEELFEQEEIYGPTGRDAQEGISGGITNLEKFLKGKRGFASGGRVGMFRGGIPKGLQAALQAIKSKFGDDSIKTVEDTQEFGLPYFNIDRPEKAIARDKFKNFGKKTKVDKRAKQNIKQSAFIKASQGSAISMDQVNNFAHFAPKLKGYLVSTANTGPIKASINRAAEGYDKAIRNIAENQQKLVIEKPKG